MTEDRSSARDDGSGADSVSDPVSTSELNEALVAKLTAPLPTVGDPVGRVTGSLGQFDERLEGFDEWQEPRPVLGGSLLLAAGLIIAYIPLALATELLFVGGSYTVIGLLFAAGVFVCGIGALLEPSQSSAFGFGGIVFSLLSLFGALGGFLVGMLLGIIGGNLCIAWTPPEDEPAGSPDQDPVEVQTDQTPAQVGTEPVRAEPAAEAVADGASHSETGADATVVAEPAPTDDNGERGSDDSTGEHGSDDTDAHRPKEDDGSDTDVDFRVVK